MWGYLSFIGGIIYGKIYPKLNLDGDGMNFGKLSHIWIYFGALLMLVIGLILLFKLGKTLYLQVVSVCLLFLFTGFTFYLNDPRELINNYALLPILIWYAVLPLSTGFKRE